MAASLPDSARARGIVRLLNTAGGRVLCLAGDVDAPAVDAFRRRYGREPVRVDHIDAGSVTALSPSAVELLREHLALAWRAGLPVHLHRSAAVAARLAAADAAADLPV